MQQAPSSSSHSAKELVQPFAATLLPAFFVLGMLRLHGAGSTAVAVAWLVATAVCLWLLQTPKLSLRFSLRCVFCGICLIVVGLAAAALIQDFARPGVAAPEQATAAFRIQLLRDFYLVFSAGVGANALFHGLCLLRDEKA